MVAHIAEQAQVQSLLLASPPLPTPRHTCCTPAVASDNRPRGLHCVPGAEPCTFCLVCPVCATPTPGLCDQIWHCCVGLGNGERGTGKATVSVFCNAHNILIHPPGASLACPLFSFCPWCGWHPSRREVDTLAFESVYFSNLELYIDRFVNPVRASADPPCATPCTLSGTIK